MVLYKRKEIRFIVSIAVLLFFPLFCNAAATEEPEEEILFITSYNSDTKYTYDNISTFIETYTQLGGRYSTIVENMNATDLTQAHQWKKTLTDILDKHPKAKLVILLGLSLIHISPISPPIELPRLPPIEAPAMIAPGFPIRPDAHPLKSKAESKITVSCFFMSLSI